MHEQLQHTQFKILMSSYNKMSNRVRFVVRACGMCVSVHMAIRIRGIRTQKPPREHLYTQTH